MSITCPQCGAVASYGNELGHKSDCPSLRKQFDFKTLRRLTPEEEDRARQKANRPRTPEEQAAFQRMVTMPVDDEEDPVEGAERSLNSRGIPT